ncbi:hypothetical protein [Actinomadura oligospora]|uniref:hypothetical protein n=1 Tax=Actinomadura oligospora TaxID=111804 RepID=UPI00047D1618|nr:hypothetical protein [Actinomadura oligospora]
MSGTQLVLAAAVAAIVIFAAAGGMAYAQSRGEKARLRGVREWADAHGWAFADENLRPPWRGRPPHENLRLGLLLGGRVGERDATIACGSYDVRRTVAAADGAERGETATYHLTVLTVQAEDGTPDMEVRERGLGAKLMGSLARNATDADAFDARFEVEPPEARGRLRETAVQAHLDSEIPAWSVRDGEITAVLPGRTRAEYLDGHVATLERLGEIVATTRIAPQS